jgi:hypothetical protein
MNEAAPQKHRRPSLSRRGPSIDLDARSADVQNPVILDFINSTNEIATSPNRAAGTECTVWGVQKSLCHHTSVRV